MRKVVQYWIVLKQYSVAAPIHLVSPKETTTKGVRKKLFLLTAAHRSTKFVVRNNFGIVLDPGKPSILYCRFGCCPDNMTNALGPDLKGCFVCEGSGDCSSCNDTVFGCCPDNVQAASGPNMEGCEEGNINIKNLKN